MLLSASTVRWRWLALGLVVINALHGYFLPQLHPQLMTVGDVSDRYDTGFTPAGYAFAIWGVIYVGFTVVCVYLLRPAQLGELRYERLARGLVVYALLGMTWTELFIRERLGASVAVIVAMLVVGGWLFIAAKRCLWTGLGRAAWFCPFSLFFGWISIATLANTATWLKSRGWAGGDAGEGLWTIALIAVAAALGVVVSRKWRDSLYPLVLAWALAGIWVKHRHSGQPVEFVALAAAMAMVLWSVIIAGWIRSHALVSRDLATGRPSAPPFPAEPGSSHFASR